MSLFAVRRRLKGWRLVMRTALFTCAVLLGTLPADAQTIDRRFYVAATTATDGGNRGLIWSGVVPSASVLFGGRISESWGVEIEIERAFRDTSRTDEAVWISYPPMQNPTREDIERYGIRARFDRRQTAGAGWSAHVVWRTRDPGRVNAALLGGVFSRVYDSRVIRTTTFVPPELNLPSTHSSVQNDTSSRHMVAGGFAAGFLVLVRVTPALTIAPEVRCNSGVITDDPYTVFRAGLRAMWSF
jgi:hypothetical protein